jgi:hypothetical protein
MKAFISSVIRGLEEFRDAADRGASVVDFEVLRSEQFGASPETPQRACLAAARQSDVTVLLLGPRYGEPQDSGLSATHEEYREIREIRPVLAFIQEGVEFEARQRDFVKEVQAWSQGQTTDTFSSEEDLQFKVTRQLHRITVTQASGIVDCERIAQASLKLLPLDHEVHQATLCCTLAGGPPQSILKPSELESEQFARQVLREATFGQNAVLAYSEKTETPIRGSERILEQPDRSIRLGEVGSIAIQQPAVVEDRSRQLVAVIEEDIEDALVKALSFSGTILEQIDPLHRLSELAISAALYRCNYLEWRTRKEDEIRPNQFTASGVSERVIVQLTPPCIRRAKLVQASPELARELMVLLRRSFCA